MRFRAALPPFNLPSRQGRRDPPTPTSALTLESQTAIRFTDPVDVTQVDSIFRALNEAQVRYLVVGGVAVIAHGYVRFTKDLDLVIGLEPENVARALAALESIRYRPLVPVPQLAFADPIQRERWITEKHMIVFQMLDIDEPRTRLDIFVREPFDFANEYAQAFWQEYRGQNVPFVRRDALFKMKLDAGRPQDLVDIDQICLAKELPPYDKLPEPPSWT
jgi:hypothetical protein